MTIDERIAQLARVKHYAAPRHYETLDMAIETMRKYQKIEELYDYWRSGKCEYTISCMENIGKVLRDGNDECHLAIKALEQEPRTGHWIDDKCSVCGKGTEDLISSPEWYRNEEPNFCPFCGVKIESENNKVKNPMEQTLDFLKNLYLQNKEEIDRVAKEYKVIEADKAETENKE